MPTAALAATVLLALVCILLVVSEAAELAVLVKGAAIARGRRAGRFHLGEGLLRSPLAPSAAIVAVPPNASDESRLAISRLLKMRAGDAEVVVVLDGPSDAERAIWIHDFKLEPTHRTPDSSSLAQPWRCVYRSRSPISLFVIDRQHGSLAECLNTAVSFTQASVIAVMDRSAEFSEDALLRSLEHFIAGPERTVALCAVGPAPSSPGLPARLYRLEFLRTWLSRCALAGWNCALPVPGSLTLFDRESILRLGGFRGGALEMVLRLHRMCRTAGSPERIGFLPSDAVHPHVPRTWKQFRAARTRIRSEERQAVSLSGLIHHYYFRPVSGLALVILGAAVYGFGWMEPAVLLRLVGGTLGFRILASASAVVLGEFAIPAEGGPRDLAALFLTALCLWTK